MAIIAQKPKVNLNVTLQCEEAEARALSELMAYGEDEVINAIKTSISELYIKEHGGALRLFLRSLKTMLPPLMEKADRARRAFDE